MATRRNSNRSGGSTGQASPGRRDPRNAAGSPSGGPESPSGKPGSRVSPAQRWIRRKLPLLAAILLVMLGWSVFGPLFTRQNPELTWSPGADTRAALIAFPRSDEVELLDDAFSPTAHRLDRAVLLGLDEIRDSQTTVIVEQPDGRYRVRKSDLVLRPAGDATPLVGRLNQAIASWGEATDYRSVDFAVDDDFLVLTLVTRDGRITRYRYKAASGLSVSDIRLQTRSPFSSP